MSAVRRLMRALARLARPRPADKRSQGRVREDLWNNQPLTDGRPKGH